MGVECDEITDKDKKEEKMEITHNQIEFCSKFTVVFKCQRGWRMEAKKKKRTTVS